MLKAGKRILLQNSAITTTVRGGEGDVGNITANTFEGTGENIALGRIISLKSADSRVSASSSLGINGTAEISALEVDLSGGLVALPAHFFDATALLLKRALYAARGLGKLGGSRARRHSASARQLSAQLSARPGRLLPSGKEHHGIIRRLALAATAGSLGTLRES